MDQFHSVGYRFIHSEIVVHICNSAALHLHVPSFSVVVLNDDPNHILNAYGCRTERITMRLCIALIPVLLTDHQHVLITNCSCICRASGVLLLKAFNAETLYFHTRSTCNIGRLPPCTLFCRFSSYGVTFIKLNEGRLCYSYHLYT